MGEIMGFLDKVKNLFTEPEDSDDEIQIEQIKKEGSKISIEPKKTVSPIEEKNIDLEVIKEEKNNNDNKNEMEVEKNFLTQEQPVKRISREQIKTPIFFTEEEFADLEPERPKKVETKRIVEQKKVPLFLKICHTGLMDIPFEIPYTRILTRLGYKKSTSTMLSCQLEAVKSVIEEAAGFITLKGTYIIQDFKPAEHGIELESGDIITGTLPAKLNGSASSALIMAATSGKAIMDKIEPLMFTEKEQEKVDELFPMCPQISIDYAVMEPASKDGLVFTHPAEFGWSDLGNWASLHDKLQKDTNGNGVVGNIKLYECSNCVVHAEDAKKVVLQGLDGYIVSEKNGQILVCKRSEEQRIREFSAE